ncbi:MAG: alcohol dehydrogenase catalytic domain-containing protein [Proteobacteria bacterium]|nr:alcohol dehydrogenase catalytic domain-containing protein [Pseudomonadota bacterium]
MAKNGKMKAALKVEPKAGIRFGELPIPAISPEEVLIRVKAVGICGSDVHIYEWTPGYEGLAEYMPLVLGHEFAGEVAKVGSQVSGVKIGDRVAYQGGSCGQCLYCNTGRHSLCDQRKAAGRIGLEKKGGMAEYVAVSVRQNFLPQIPAGVSFEEAAQGQPTAEALHIVEQAGISLGEPVVVLGAGPIAVTAAQAAKANGASPVIVTGLTRDKARLEIAKSLGADVTIDVEKEDPVEKVRAMTGGLGAAKVLEVSGSPKAFNQGLELLRKGGTLVCFGIYPENISVDFTRRVVREMKIIRGVYGASRLGWNKVLSFMASGQIRVAPLITHRLPLEQVDEGFRACQQRKAMKVILLPS